MRVESTVLLIRRSRVSNKTNDDMDDTVGGHLKVWELLVIRYVNCAFGATLSNTRLTTT